MAGFVALTNAGYMSPEMKADLDFVREKFGLEIVESLPYSAPALPAQPGSVPTRPDTPDGDGDDQEDEDSPASDETPEEPAQMRLRLLKGVKDEVRA